MKSFGLQKSRFLNSIELGEIWKCNLDLYSKTIIFIFFLNWEKLRSPARATFKNPKISLLIGKNVKVYPKTNTANPNFESMDELGKIGSLLKIKLFTFISNLTYNKRDISLLLI